MIAAMVTRWRWWRIDAAGAAICVAATLGVYFLGLKPLVQRHASRAALQVELASRREESRKLQVKVGELQERQGSVQKALSDSPLRLQTALHTNRRLAEIAELATQCGLKVDEIQPGKVRAGQRYEVVPIRLTGQGTYPTCVQFLRRLQGKFPDTGGVRLELNARSEAGETLAAFEFNLEWYTAPRPEAGQ